MIIINIERNALLNEKKINAEIITDMLAKISAFHIEKFSYYQLEENTRQLQSNVKNNSKGEIVSIIITDANGNKLNPSGLDEDRIKLPVKYWLVKEKLCEYYSNGRNTRIVGKIKIIFSLESIEKEIFNLSFKIAMVLFPIILLTGFAISFMLYIFITKPLKQLTVMADNIGHGNYDISFDTKSNDEIAFLGKTFTKMCGFIRENFSQIQKQKLEIEQYNTHLESMVEQRTKELVKAEKLASLGALVSGVAHEINTPVGISVTGASLLKKETTRVSELFNTKSLKLSDFENYIGICNETGNLILSNLNRAADLISSFKQVAVDQSSESKRKFLLNHYINEIIQSIKPQFKKYDITLDINIDEKIEIDGYPGPFAQVMANLFLNSLIHGYDKGAKGLIRIDAHIEENNVIIKYTDDGKGIPKESLRKIYDPFFTTKRNEGSTGLGMHIIYNIITQKFNGSIDCTSEVNMGVQFIIKLPLTM